MITKDELELLIAGAVSTAGSAIAKPNGRVLTGTETEGLERAISVAMRMLVEHTRAKVSPPPQPAVKATQLFRPMLTQELPVVADEDIQQALDSMVKVDAIKTVK